MSFASSRVRPYLLAMLGVLSLTSALSACGGARGGRLPRNVRSSFARDFRGCSVRNISGNEIGGGRYYVSGCGYEAIYICASRRECYVESPVQGYQGQGYQGQGQAYAVVQEPAQQQQAPILIYQTGGEAPRQQVINSSLQVSDYLNTQANQLRQCSQRSPLELAVAWDAQGALRVAMPSAVGSPEENCLKNLLEPSVRVAGGEAGAISYSLR